MNRASRTVKTILIRSAPSVMAAAMSLFSFTLQAHEWHRDSLPESGAEREALRSHIMEEWRQHQEYPANTPGDLSVRPVMLAANASNTSVMRFVLGAAAGTGTTAGPVQATAFQKFSRLKLRWDTDFLYIESNGMPDHNMMVGITAWQQQVPLPQPYVGDNAWRIPLHPVVAKEPASIKGRFLRGAIALAANGIPIFNPQNNRGEVSAEIGELDQWGGHCGRADDYHYHAAPLHLQSVVGKGLPIAYALDGYPIYGLTEADGSAAGKLDAFNGHEIPGVAYHYHASLKYPYVNGGFHGEVVEREQQVDPQPRAQPVRSDTVPLRGAEITGFKSADANHYQLSYKVAGEAREIRYSILNGVSYEFEFNNGRQGIVKQTYSRQAGGGKKRESGRRETGGPDKEPEISRSEVTPAKSASTSRASGSFVLTSPEVTDGGNLPMDYTGDGTGSTLPLEWKGAPAGTNSFALIMDHLAPGNEMKSYWVIRDMPAEVTSLPKNVKGVGKPGVGFKGEIGYEPPHSKGPGAKTYVIHLYALSEAPDIYGSPSSVNREVLLAAMEGKILAEADLRVVYTRDSGTAGGGRSNEGRAVRGVMAPGVTEQPDVSVESKVKPGPAMDGKMKELCYLIIGVLAVALLISIYPGRKGLGKEAISRWEDEGGEEVSPAVVPAYLFNIMLGRPGADVMTASVLSWESMEGFIEYGQKPDALNFHTRSFKLLAGEPVSVLLEGLKPDSCYFYRFIYRRGESTETLCDEVRSFHTQRTPESSFTFTTQADSHLDVSTDVNVYQQTLANMLGDRPDFMIDLGDTTMVDKFGNFFTRAESQYRAQRYYLGQLAHSVPILLTLGNHDGEAASRLNGQPYSMPLWSLGKRKKYFPNPEPGGIYSGNDTPFENAGLLQNYFAWEWGSALFLVLDPFWASPRKKCEDNWSMTLGDAQYRWLTKTLEMSKAPFKFVFIHHLVGGLGRDARGGVTPAPFMEWGGKNADGTDGFSQHRPDWALPIHQLLVKHGVSIVFHGHDHLYVKEELDGIIYQEVPQPGHPGSGTRSAEEYGYTGTILGSSGHLRVHVSANETQVDYVRAAVAGVTKGDVTNGAVAHSYTIVPGSVSRENRNQLSILQPL